MAVTRGNEENRILRSTLKSITRVTSIYCYVLFFKVIDVNSLSQSASIISISINDSWGLEKYPKLPRVGKCCSLKEVMSKDENGMAKCIPAEAQNYKIFSPYFSDFNKTGALAPGDKKDNFVTVVGDPCKHKRYMLEPEISSDDEHYLLLNGSIFSPHQVPSMLALGSDYCMDIIPDRGLRTLVCFQEQDQVTGDFRLTFYACGLLISVPFLILTIIAYCITPKLMDVHGKALCHYCGCLVVAFTTLATVQLASAHLNDQFCVSIAFVIQFSFVACFFWLNVMCLETYLLLRRYIDTGNWAPTKPKKLFFYYSLWAWTPPAILIIISMVANLSPTVPIAFVKPNFGSERCWFESDVNAMPYFYVPVGLLVIANVVLFALTAVEITRHQRELDLRRLRENRESGRDERRTLSWLRRLFLVCLALFFLMGINWAMEVISWCAGGDPLTWSAFDFVNALQGIFVFGIFVLRKPIRYLVWYQVQKLRGVDSNEPEVASMDRCLLTVLNVERFSRERIS